MNLIPIINSQAGGCLTAANWQQLGVAVGAFDLGTLIFRPGLSLLKAVQPIKDYLGWSGKFIINASHLQANKLGNYVLTSPYDGTKITLSQADLVELILALRPDLVLLPSQISVSYPQLWQHWDERILPFISVDDSAERPHGVYCTLQSFKPVLVPIYVMGVTRASLANINNPAGIYLEMDEPAGLALQGLVYSQQGILDLNDPAYAMEFTPIDASCQCPTCTMHLTKAYLHHLFSNTPLLAQRFLMQHNVYLLGNSLYYVTL